MIRIGLEYICNWNWNKTTNKAVHVLRRTRKFYRFVRKCINALSFFKKHILSTDNVDRQRTITLTNLDPFKSTSGYDLTQRPC